MKTLSTPVATASVILGASLLVATPASAEERICRGTIGAVTLDNVKVPSGATCTLKGTRVKGNIVVNSKATLRANGAVVNGNIQSEGHRLVVVNNTRVGGSIQLKQGGGLTVSANKVEGDVQIFSNKSGTKTIRNNRIDGNLQCKSNTPAPIGSGNVVDGNKEDQCRRL